MRVIVAALLVAVALAQQPGIAQQPPAVRQPEPDPKRPARIEGTVVDSTGAPVRGAQVALTGQISYRGGTLTQAANYRATSDDAGRFVIEDIEPAPSLTLQATKAGFVVGRYGARSPQATAVPLALESGQTLTGLTIRMTQQGAIAGRVVDESGDPVVGARVTAQPRSYPGGQQQQLTSLLAGAGLGVVTDDRGEFRLAPVSAGRYYLSVAPARTTAENINTTLLTTYYPNAADPRGATPIVLTAGQEIKGLEVRMRQGRIYTVSGKVVDAAGMPVANAQLISMPAGIRDIAEILPMILQLGIQATKADGTFLIRNLAAGSYEIATIDAAAAQALTQGQGLKLAMGNFAITNDDVKDLTLVMGSGPVVSGSVRLEDGELREILPETKPTGTAIEQMLAAQLATALPGVVASEGGPLSVGLNGTTPSILRGSPAGIVQPDGTFQVQNLTPGIYQLAMPALPKGIYLKSVTYGGSDALQSGVTVSGGGGTLEIVLAKNAGTVVATVKRESGEPEVGVTIALWPNEPQAGLANSIRSTATDRNGTVEFRNLRPGTYYIAAFDDVNPALTQVQDFLSQLQSDAVKIEVQEGGTITQSLQWIAAEKIRAAEENLR